MSYLDRLAGLAPRIPVLTLTMILVAGLPAEIVRVVVLVFLAWYIVAPGVLRWWEGIVAPVRSSTTWIEVRQR